MAEWAERGVGRMAARSARPVGMCLSAPEGPEGGSEVREDQ